MDFDTVEGLIGVSLPRDFVELAAHYPTLELDQFLRVPTPAPGAERQYVDGIFHEIEILKDLVDDEISGGYVAYPNPGGLIPWSESLSGDVFYWCTAGEPDDWPVVVNSRNGEWWEFHGGALAFLVGLFDHSIERRGLPADVPGPDPLVRSFPDLPTD